MGKWSELEEQVVDVIIRKESRKTPCGPSLQRRCCNSCFSRKSLKDYYFRAGMLTGIFLFMFLAFLIWLVFPFLKTLHFKPATCRHTSVSPTSGSSSCQCGKGCIGYFPCMIVHVRYSSKDGQQSGNSMLHDGEFGGQCSFYPPCRLWEEANKQAVSDWVDEIKSGSFSCFYDPSKDGGYVMRSPALNIHGTVHLLLWPGLAFIASLVMLIIMCRTCGCRYVCMSKPPPDITAAAESLLETGQPSLVDFSLEERETMVNQTRPDSC